MQNPKHEHDCDDCQADERGPQISTDDETNCWYIFFAHDTYGDGYWKGARYEVIGGPYVDKVTAVITLQEMRAQAA